ncbi:putative Transcription factor bHLH115 [Cocos nucifera]|uniref:Putative Transcription factor bHLH115 n=1 Tax=Cocos nucifera TaxID=13894 RepID=A0A8K0IKN6_COCNU|nr:putative Transcription factor bHLH115 [Cocos nucifera]
MGSNAIEDYWIDGGGSDGELRCALESFCDMAPTAGVGIEEAYRDVCGLEQTRSRKRIKDESCAGPKSKACREKMRRDRLNDRFLELSSILDPGRPPKFDKSSILSDAARLLVQLRSEAQQVKESNEKLQETIKDLKVEKNELRDEKMRLKADKERINTLPVTVKEPHTLGRFLLERSVVMQNQAVLEMKVSGGLSREDLERIAGKDDSTFSGVDLATLIRKKYGRSYDVQLIKKFYNMAFNINFHHSAFLASSIVIFNTGFFG